MGSLRSLLLLGLLTGCDRSPDPAEQGAGGMMHQGMRGSIDTMGLRAIAVPAEFQKGKSLFEANCAGCHGEAALGTEQGPPLVHMVYEPSHHADVAFLLAAERGVRAHHWDFGDMPPVTGVSREEIREIVGYVRWLQRQAGVY
jgi:mono/diheme cytochrome c family protein